MAATKQQEAYETLYVSLEIYASQSNSQRDEAKTVMTIELVIICCQLVWLWLGQPIMVSFICGEVVIFHVIQYKAEPGLETKDEISWCN